MRRKRYYLDRMQAVAEENERAARFAADQARIAAQRAAWASFYGPEKGALKKLILDRAWQLLDAGSAEAADALLEFLPEADAIALLDEFFGHDA